MDEYEFTREGDAVVGTQLRDTLDSAASELIAGMMIQSAYLKGKKRFTEEDLYLFPDDFRNVLDFYAVSLDKNKLKSFFGLAAANNGLQECLIRADSLGLIEDVNEEYVKPTQKMIGLLVEKGVFRKV